MDVADPTSNTASPVAIKPQVHSLVLLSHLRWIAALIVVLSHIALNLLNKGGQASSSEATYSGLVTKPIFQIEGFGHAAVVVFFVLSGFLVGGKLLELKDSLQFDREWPRFLLDRFVRIFVVLWPALLLTAVVFIAVIVFAPSAPFVRAGRWSLAIVTPISFDHIYTRWVAAAFLFNELLTPTLETNGPLWSLSYEWYYYMVALAALLLFRRRFSSIPLLVIGYTFILVIISVWRQPNIPFSGITWLLGVAARIAFNRNLLTGSGSRMIGILCVLAVLIAEHWRPLPDLVLAAALATMICHSTWKTWSWGAKWGDHLASFSYSLYVIHYPILISIMAILYCTGNLHQRLPFSFKSLALCAVTLVLIVSISRLFAVFTEDQTRRVKGKLLRVLMPNLAVVTKV